MSEPPQGRPEFSAPSYAACYRHQDRSTLITCQRCGRPICGECMNPAAVGFQCPDCVRSGGATPFPGAGGGSGRSFFGRSRAGSGWGAPRARQPKTVFGANLSNRQSPMTKAIMVALAVVWVSGLLTRGLTTGLLGLDPVGLASGQFWRLATSAFVSFGLLALLMNLLVLWLAGQVLEQQLGAWRFLALYVLSAAGGGTLFFLMAGFGGSIAGSSAAVVGLLAANGVIKLRRREDVRGDVALLILLLAYAFAVSGVEYFASQLGGMVVGALTGVTLAYAPRRHRTALQVAGLVLIAVICVGVVAARSFVL